MIAIMIDYCLFFSSIGSEEKWIFFYFFALMGRTWH